MCSLATRLLSATLRVSFVVLAMTHAPPPSGVLSFISVYATLDFDKPKSESGTRFLDNPIVVRPYTGGGYSNHIRRRVKAPAFGSLTPSA